MPVLTVPSTSTVYIWQQVTATLGGTTYNPTADTVQMAAVPVPAYGAAPSPAPGQWQNAIWETDPGPVYWAKMLIGPSNGGLVLTPGAYQIFVKVTDSPEIPVLAGWQLLIAA